MKLTGDRNCCPTCGEYFNSTGAFDKHRTGPFGTSIAPAARRCLSIDEMRAIGMSLNAQGFWAKAAMTDAERERARSKRAESTHDL